MQIQNKGSIQDKILPRGKVSFQSGGSQFIVDDKYEYKKHISSGAYGIVASGKNKLTNQLIAIKKIPNAFQDLVDAKRILREIKLLKFFDHENIISILDLQKPDNNTGFDDIYIITDLMETDLHRVIYSKQDLSDEHIQYFMYQLLRGLLYMHSANVIHRDIKPSNLLVNKNCDLKICDLGLGRGFEQEDEFKTEYVVTRWYRAPEVILNASEYNKAIDVWSAGCIFAELIGRNPLFPGEDYLDQVQRVIAVLGSPSKQDLSYIGNDSALNYIKSLPKRTKQNWQQLFPNANPVGLDLLNKMLTFNPDNRLTVEQALRHSYFDGLSDPEEEPLADKPFDWSWDNFEPTKEILQQMVYHESLSFHKENKNQKY